MTMTDPIADMLTRVRNGLQVQKRFVDVPSSRIKSNIALVLKDEGYLNDVESVQNERNHSVLRLHLKYDQDGAPVIRELKRVSKPGCRVYADSTHAPKVRGAPTLHQKASNFMETATPLSPWATALTNLIAVASKNFEIAQNSETFRFFRC